MHNRVIKLSAVLLVMTLFCLCFSACQKNRFSVDSLDEHKNTLTHDYSFDSHDKSEQIGFDSEKLSGYISDIKNLSVDYGYPEMFNYQKAMEGVNADCTVAKHSFSALDDNGALTKEHLLEIVNHNTEKYLEETPLLTEIDNQEFLLRVCEIIVKVTNDILKQYPDIDKDRVYCNLGNLKIIENKSAVADYAAVEPGMVLRFNSTTAKTANIMQNASMYSTVIHETMHIIQYGCTCEPNKACTRRCGLAHAYDSWEQDYADWLWLSEASAERLVCLYSDVEPMTYQNMVRYLISMDLSTMLQENVPANYLETVNFYSEPKMLFDLFGCENEQDKEEIYHLIYALEMMHMQPDDVKAAFKNKYGQELDGSVADDFNSKIKRPIIKTLTKTFYRNLSQTVANSQMTKNDLLFLVNLFESTINYHMGFDDSKYDDYNVEFVQWYKQVRDGFFGCLTNATDAEYAEYNAKKSETVLNAGMQWLDSEKRCFLSDKYEALNSVYKLAV